MAGPGGPSAGDASLPPRTYIEPLFKERQGAEPAQRSMRLWYRDPSRQTVAWEWEMPS
jgi:hypothetical protein